jgi:hypothetical protein
MTIHDLRDDLSLVQPSESFSSQEWADYTGHLLRDDQTDLAKRFLRQRDPEGSGLTIHARMQRDTAYKDMITNMIRLAQDFYAGNVHVARIVELAQSSDAFTNILANVQYNQLVQAYRNYPKTYRNLFWMTMVDDFKTVYRSQEYGTAGGLSPVAEGETYPEVDRADRQYSFSVAKHGRVFARLTWEAVRNDTLGAFRMMPSQGAKEAVYAEMRFATDLYAANTTLYSTTHAVLGTNYSNRLDLALANSALETAVNTMATYVDEAGQPILNTDALWLVVPPELQLTALESITTDFVPATQANTNLLELVRGIEVIIDPYLPISDGTSGTTGWYLFQKNPDAAAYAVEMAFLSGMEEPQLMAEDGNTIEISGSTGMNTKFAQDTMRWAWRHVFGGSHANAVGGWRYSLFSDGVP